MIFPRAKRNLVHTQGGTKYIYDGEKWVYHSEPDVRETRIVEAEVPLEFNENMVPTMVLDGNSLPVASGEILAKPGGIKEYRTFTTGLGYQDGGEYIGFWNSQGQERDQEPIPCIVRTLCDGEYQVSGIVRVNRNNQGSGYTEDDVDKVVSVSGSVGTGATVRITGVKEDGRVDSVELVEFGSNYILKEICTTDDTDTDGTGLALSVEDVSNHGTTVTAIEFVDAGAYWRVRDQMIVTVPGPGNEWYGSGGKHQYPVLIEVQEIY